MRVIQDHAALLAASHDDTFVRCMVALDVPLRGWALDDADDAASVAWVRRSPRGRTTLTVRASVPAAVRAVPDLILAAPDIEFLTLPRGAAEPLADVLDLRVGDDWEWLSTATAPAVHPAEQAVRALTEADRPDVAALLAAASPRHSAEPDDPDVLWHGLRDERGALMACAATQSVGPGLPHLASIATHPEVRGRGWGAAVTAAATRSAFAQGAPVVTLAMYANNAVARRMYGRLGFGDGYQWSSRRRQRRRDRS